MLVLSRQRDETIMIGDEIEITVVDIRGDKVRLGITAPTKIAVHRKEVYDAIRQENLRASQLAGADLASVRPPSGVRLPRPGLAARACAGGGGPGGPIGSARARPDLPRTLPFTAEAPR